jgi:probable rRNA maturation factor
VTSITVSNRQRGVRVPLSALRQFATGALSECVKLSPRNSSALPEVTVILVSDKRIADIHRRFMNEASPTDVITFQHGEIFISAETAKRQAKVFRTSLDHELRLYLVHGLLHLCGLDDTTRAGAAEMKRVQEKLVARVERAIRR